METCGTGEKAHTKVVTADLWAAIRTQDALNTNRNKLCVSTTVTLSSAAISETALSALYQQNARPSPPSD
jgi:hypothetical protein